MLFRKVLLSCLFLGIVSLLLSACGSSVKPRQSAAAVDSPDVHYRHGQRLLNANNLVEAGAAFDLAKSLDPRYAPAYEGIAAVLLRQGELDEAEKNARKSLDLDNKWVPARVVLARIESARGQHKRAIKSAEKALDKVDEASVPDRRAAQVEAQMALADVYRAAEMYPEAQAAYQQVLEQDNRHTGAEKAIKALAEYQSAVAGQSPELRKVAGQAAITRAEMAVILVSELPLAKIMRRNPQSAGFRAPDAESATAAKMTPPADVAADYWARSFIVEVLAADVMELLPGRLFMPEQNITRAEVAAVLENFIGRYWNDSDLSTRFFGSTSPFSDVANTSPLFNAVMVVTSRDWMSADNAGLFQPLGSISGSEALNIVRRLKADLGR